MDANIFKQITLSIIKQQERVLGSLAWLEAGKVTGLTVKDHDVTLGKDAKKILGGLVAQYEALFGQASVEVCRGAVKSVAGDVEKAELPAILQ
jgi:hypothetical protein